MLKFIKGHMESISGVEVYPMVSLLIFFIFFVLLFWWVATAKKEYTDSMSHIPLEPDNQEKQ